MGRSDPDNPLAEDLEHVQAHTRDLWEDLRGRRIFITGGTGFFGRWLLESFAWANDSLRLGAQAVVLSRDPDAFRAKAPRLADHPAIRFHRGDVRDFEFPGGEFSHVIHAATESSAALNEEDPLLMIDTIVEGTRRTLDFAHRAGVRKILLTSSGAVYGRQPPEITHVGEEYAGGPDLTQPGSAYGEGKRLAELLCAICARQFGIEAKIARCFAFVGPHLPLDAHFAVGNFLRDALAGGPIVVQGDGTAYRSYLYAADLAVWLWTILFQGRSCVPYNVGSEAAVSIAELARLVRQAVPSHPAIQVMKTPATGPPPRYVPSIERAAKELSLRPWVPLSDALRRTLFWYSGRGR